MDNMKNTANTNVTPEELVIDPSAGIGFEVKAPESNEQVPAINVNAALESYSEQERQEIIALSEVIDVRKKDQVMDYGSEVLLNTFNECQAILKKESGSAADQKVKAEVMAISAKAAESYEDFNIELREPTFLQKFLLWLKTGGKTSHADKVRERAVTCYNIVGEFRGALDGWQKMLENSMSDINVAGISDIESVGLLEKYIIAGRLALPRIEEEVQTALVRAQDTNLLRDKDDYDELNRGYKMFQVALTNLEKSRVMSYLSVGQLTLNKRSTENLQMSIKTQKNHAMALLAQQLRNAVINARTQEVLEGQKSINRLNDELIKHVSNSICLTAKETEELLYNGFCNVEAAKIAVNTVISGCRDVQKASEELLPKMRAEAEQLNALVDELTPIVRKTAGSDKNTTTSVPTTTGKSGLKGGLKF